MQSSIFTNVPNILLVGMGYMGKIYIKILLALGVSPEALTIVDVRQDRIDEGKKLYPECNFITVDKEDNYEEIIGEQNIEIAFCLVNTPSHFKIIQNCLFAGVRNIFVEKPFTYTCEEADQLLELDLSQHKIMTAYLINFSKAFELLLEYLNNHNLKVIEARSEWGKNRTSSKRPTPGNLIDEPTHAINLILNAIRHNQTIRNIRVANKICSYIPYVDEEVQKKAREADPSMTDTPSSSSYITFVIKTPEQPIILNSSSSYIRSKQKREVEFNLCSVDSPNFRNEYTITLNFDVSGKDYLEFQNAETKEIKEYEFPAKNKVTDEVTAFLDYVLHDKLDKRLTTLEEAVELVKLIEGDDL